MQPPNWRSPTLRKNEHVGTFLVGFGMGAVTSVLLASDTARKTRRRIRSVVKSAKGAVTKRAEAVAYAAREAFEEGQRKWTDGRKERNRTMSNLKDKAKEKIDHVADAAKKVTDQAADKATDLAHKAGKKMEQGGKRLQDA